MGRKVTIDEFLDRAKAAHGDRYDYSQVRFINTSTKIKIICPKHGPFMQLPYTHMRGGGCKQCSSEQRALTTKDFIERARDIFLAINMTTAWLNMKICIAKLMWYVQSTECSVSNR